jgi:arylsulfatase A-like enzyme
MNPARALSFLALSLAALGCGSGRVEVFEQPDVILVVIDTWRWDALGANGSPRANVTPNLDHLAAKGVRFSRAFTSSPWTGSSVGTMVTGQLPTVHGVYGRFADVGSLRPSVPTLAELFSAAGYRTLAVANGFFVGPTFGFKRGYELYDFDASSNRKMRPPGRRWTPR